MIDTKCIDDKSRIYVCVLGFGIAITMFFVTLAKIYTNGETGRLAIINWLYSSNVKIYMFSIITFFVFYGLSYIIFSRFLIGDRQLSIQVKMPVLQKLISIITFSCLFGLFAKWGLYDQYKELGFVAGYGDYSAVVLAAVGILGVIVLVIDKPFIKGDLKQGYLNAVSIGTTVFTFLLHFVVNPFATGDFRFSSNISFYSAGTETIYNVIDKVPFSISTTGLYGHYSLVLAPVVWILNKLNISYNLGIALVISIVAAAVHLLNIYSITSFSPKKWVSAILILAAVPRENYFFPGCWPIRLFGLSVAVAYLTYLHKHDSVLESHKWEAVSVMICGLLLLWNVETGVPACGGVIVFYTISSIKKGQTLWKTCFLAITYSMLFFTGACFSALLIANLYNLVTGGNLIFSEFFYPLVRADASQYMLDLNRCNVPFGNHLWIYIIPFFLGVIGYCIVYAVVLLRKKIDNNQRNDIPILCALGVIALGAFVYYFNEAHWGATHIVRGFFFVMVSVIAGISFRCSDDYLGKTKELYLCVYKGLLITMLSIGLAYAAQSYKDVSVIKSKYVNDFYSFSKIKSEIDDIATQTPQDTYGVGQGINVIYHEMNRGNHARYRDTSSLFSSDNMTFDLLVEEILQENAFIIDEEYSYETVIKDSLTERKNYKRMKEFTVGNVVYGYYEAE